MREVSGSVARIVVASGVMGAVVWAGASLGRWELGGNDPRNLAIFVGTAVAGVLAYLAVAGALRAPELRDLRAALARRVRA
jgi:hypothetical protein